MSRVGAGALMPPWDKFVISLALLCTVCKRSSMCALALTISSQVLLVDCAVGVSNTAPAAAPCASIIGAYLRAFAPCCSTDTREFAQFLLCVRLQVFTWRAPPLVKVPLPAAQTRLQPSTSVVTIAVGVYVTPQTIARFSLLWLLLGRGLLLVACRLMLSPTHRGFSPSRRTAMSARFAICATRTFPHGSRTTSRAGNSGRAGRARMCTRVIQTASGLATKTPLARACAQPTRSGCVVDSCGRGVVVVLLERVARSMVRSVTTPSSAACVKSSEW